MDEATLGRLRRAIAAEDGDEEEQQLKGVLRMLGAEIRDETQIPLFGKAPAGQAPKPRGASRSRFASAEAFGSPLRPKQSG